ncbi:MAG: hypothetical protein ACLQBX_09585 [Candidatus Limnocylindrales bacterium]
MSELPPIGSPARRRCTAVTPSGAPCRAAPLHGSDRCPYHDRDPVRAEQVARARVEGGRRRHKEAVLGIAYDLQDLETVAGVYRLLTIVVTLALAHDPPQLRILTTVAGLAIKLHEVGDLRPRVRQESAGG